MFWECHIVTSSVDKLLNQSLDTLKLQDFLDENDLIQECLTQNKRLIDYLVQPNIMNELIGHVITRPIDDNFRNAHVVSELLSGDFQRIQETLLEKEHLDLLYSFLLSKQTDDQSILNPILASYFSTDTNDFNYTKNQMKILHIFIRHQLLMSYIVLISDCGEQRMEAIKWYEDINFN